MNFENLFFFVYFFFKKTYRIVEDSRYGDQVQRLKTKLLRMAGTQDVRNNMDEYAVEVASGHLFYGFLVNNDT